MTEPKSKAPEPVGDQELITEEEEEVEIERELTVTLLIA